MAVSLLGRLRVATAGSWMGGVREPATGDGYVGLDADDVDHLRGELVKLRATVNCHVPAARQALVLVTAGSER